MNQEAKYELYKQIMFHLADGNWDTVRKWGILKRMKLLYLFCAMSNRETRTELYGIFNKFYALPLGPVESDVYNQEYINNDVNRFSSVENLDVQNTTIKSQISEFKKENYSIINHSPSKLVDLTHYSTVWDKSFKEAKRNRKSSHPMLKNDLIEEKFLSYE
jgi:uncharacterized phage-associated protein